MTMRRSLRAACWRRPCGVLLRTRRRVRRPRGGRTNGTEPSTRVMRLTTAEVRRGDRPLATSVRDQERAGASLQPRARLRGSGRSRSCRAGVRGLSHRRARRIRSAPSSSASERFAASLRNARRCSSSRASNRKRSERHERERPRASPSAGRRWRRRGYAARRWNSRLPVDLTPRQSGRCSGLYACADPAISSAVARDRGQRLSRGWWRILAVGVVWGILDVSASKRAAVASLGEWFLESSALPSTRKHFA